MNSLYKNSLLLFSLAAFIACKKNDELLINGQYKPASTVTIDAVVMLTKEGQITKTSLIKEFVQRHGQQDYFLFDKRTDLTDNNSSTLRLDFHEDGTVDTYYMNESASSKGKISQRTSSYIDITAIESAIMPIGPNPNRWYSWKILPARPNP
ncbi:hypothetical protein G5B00_00100 [Parapedobacter sp. SGR-10]|uniref:hypothetical protein n=1 Tax=Parapedobacter sp. SGR-10 TaxID=2710879 RepID=UPI0013D80A7D|nr:hypothetical protein [Parapedobacter sp. SGR-10]NGF54898.1 hypothetical protein [Parapedobacter sp. SGR-10]